MNELEAFEYETSSTGAVRYSAPEGAHDDCVIALALAYRALSAPEEPKKKAEFGWGRKG